LAEKVEINKRLVLVNSASSLLAKIINITVLVWLHQYLLKRVSAEEYSVLVVLMTLMVFVPLFTSILTGGFCRFTIEAYALNDKRRMVEILSTLLPILSLASLGLLLMGGCFIWQMDHFLNIVPERLGDARIMMTMMVGLMAVQLVFGPYEQGLQIKQKYVLINFIRLGGECVRVSLLFIFLIGISTRVIWVVFASVTSDITVMSLLVFFSRRYLPELRFDRRAIRWSAVKGLMAFGVWNLVAQISIKMSTGVGILILSWFSTAAHTNYFYLGTLFLRKLQMVEYIASEPLMPALTAMGALKQRGRLRHAYLRGGRLGLWISLLLVIPLMVYRREVITLWLGEDFLTVATVMLFMLVFFPLQYGHIMLPKLSVAQGNLRPWAIRSIGMQVANLGLTLYLVAVKDMGVMGATLSWVSIQIVGELFLMVPLGLRLADVRFFEWIRVTIVPGFIPAFGSIFVWMGLQFLFKPQSVLSLCLCGIVGGFVYLVILGVWCLQEQDRKDFSKIWVSVKRGFMRLQLYFRRIFLNEKELIK